MECLERNISKHLNTSNVKVQLRVVWPVWRILSHLNTSNVKVQHGMDWGHSPMWRNLNTSNVKVQPQAGNSGSFLLQFKYIQC